MDNIVVAQTTQFYPDASSLMLTLQQAALAQTDRFVAVAQFLRTFAEYITQNAIGIHAGDGSR